MENLVERLREEAGRDDIVYRTVTVLMDAALKIEQLESECFKLAAGVCEHRGGDDYGNPYCLKSKTNI